MQQKQSCAKVSTFLNSLPCCAFLLAWTGWTAWPQDDQKWLHWKLWSLNSVPERRIAQYIDWFQFHLLISIQTIFLLLSCVTFAWPVAKRVIFCCVTIGFACPIVNRNRGSSPIWRPSLSPENTKKQLVRDQSTSCISTKCIITSNIAPYSTIQTSTELYGPIQYYTAL